MHNNLRLFAKWASILIIIALCFYGGYWSFKTYQAVSIEKQLKRYLLIERDYNEEDIKSTTRAWSGDGDYGVTIWVQFTDEPEVQYPYRRVNGSIWQIDDETIKWKKHVEVRPRA